MAEIVEGLGGSERERIASLRRDGHFFWADLSLADVTREQLGEALGIPDHALTPLLDFTKAALPSRKFHADGQHVVFPFQCFLEQPGLEDGGEKRLHPLEIHVLVHGDYLLTVHRERVELPGLLAGYTTEGRSEQYVVYAVLDAMVGTGFDALNDAELALEQFQLASTAAGGARVRAATLRAISVRLNSMRRQIGPQRGIFERISEEIGQVEGLDADSERYFERVYGQLQRLIDGIDAAASSMATLIDLRLNETIYWLTVVATIFLPLTFVTGFFGMNFGWMVGKIDTESAFLLLGIGMSILGALVTYVLIQRRGSPVQPDQAAVERLVSAVRRPRL
jgi:magnesium transporter